MRELLLTCFQLLARTGEWLAEPPTWAAVVFPALLCTLFIRKYGLTKWDFLAMILGVVAEGSVVHLQESDGVRQLVGTPLFSCSLLLVALSRRYELPVWKAASMAWMVLLVGDFSSMLRLGSQMPDVKLPLGIGGAGFLDALFFQPLMLAVGLELLGIARNYESRRAKLVTES